MWVFIIRTVGWQWVEFTAIILSTSIRSSDWHDLRSSSRGNDRLLHPRLCLFITLAELWRFVHLSALTLDLLLSNYIPRSIKFRFSDCTPLMSSSVTYISIYICVYRYVYSSIIWRLRAREALDSWRAAVWIVRSTIADNNLPLSSVYLPSLCSVSHSLDCTVLYRIYIYVHTPIYTCTK